MRVEIIRTKWELEKKTYEMKGHTTITRER